MRKILIIAIIVILIILGYFMIIDGMKILGIDILSVFQIKEKNDELNLSIEKISMLTSTEYPKAISNLNENSKKLLLEKENYADLVSFSNNDDVNLASHFEKYEMEYLWTKIGNHATKNGIKLKFEVTKSSAQTENQYDLKFDVTGKYASISEFIASLENDSSLAFKIENFKLLPLVDSEMLQATFIVKDISINIDKLSQPTNEQTNTNTNTNQNNTTNNTNNSNTTNSLNNS